MSERKAKTRRRRRPVDASQLSEKDKKHFDENMKDADEETKTEWLKRRAAEDAAFKKNKKIVKTWYCKNGSKLVKKSRNAKGSVLTNYVGNYMRNPEILTDEVKANLEG